MFDLGEVKFFSGSPLENVQNICASRFKMRGGVVGFGNEDVILVTRVDGLVDVADFDELLFDWAQQVEPGLNLSLGIGRFHVRRDYGDKPILGRHLMGVTHHSDVDVAVSAHLFLRKDDLGGQGVLRVGDRVIHQADATDHLSGLLHQAGDVRRIAKHLFTFGSLAAALDADDFAVVSVNEFVHGLIQHVGSSIDSGQASKALGKLSQSVEGIKVRALAVTGERVGVELDTLDSLETRLGQVRVVAVQGQGVADKVARVDVEAVLLVQLLHSHNVGVDVLPRFGITLIKVLDEDEEVLESSLLEQAHQIGAQGFAFVGGNFGDFSRLSHDVRAFDGLEFQVPEVQE